jgi:hypothetical protein
MKTQTLKFIVAALLCFSQMLNAQERYAVLISGDRPDHVYVDEGDCDVPSPLPADWEMWKASWNDTYLMWEMLVYEKGYDNEKVFVLWADGTDWSITSNIAQRV